MEFSGQPSAATLLSENPQLIVLRSLTKFYALPGLRIGAVIGNPLAVAQWRKGREPWQVNVLAEEAALTAVADKEHAARTLQFVQAERQWLLEKLRSLPGIKPCESDANFLYLRVSCFAPRIAEHLLQHKILVRDCTNWPGLPHPALRVAVRTRPENERLIEAWRTFRCD